MLDSRRSAFGYFSSLDNILKLKKGGAIIDNIKKEVEILTDTQNNILPASDSKPRDRTIDIIIKQIDKLTQVYHLELKTIERIENELNN
jgi:hypothetical protein